MIKLNASVLAGAACALLLAARAPAAGSASQNGKNTSAAAAGKEGKTTATPAAVRNAWPPESLSGKIDIVEPGQNRVVVETPDKVTYDIVVTPKTQIKSGDQTLKLSDLTQDMNKNVSVNFTPERRGDVASSIQIGG